MRIAHSKGNAQSSLGRECLVFEERSSEQHLATRDHKVKVLHANFFAFVPVCEAEACPVTQHQRHRTAEPGLRALSIFVSFSETKYLVTRDYKVMQTALHSYRCARRRYVPCPIPRVRYSRAG
jgi:hypothetical protein